VSVFLRWGIFGILGVAALLYAYNASKRMAEHHAQNAAAHVVSATAPPVPVAEVVKPVPDPGSSPGPTPAQKAAPHCEAELMIAQRAIEARKQGEPIDRLLRIPEIAWQEPPTRRQRLETVATEWFNRDSDWSPEVLRIAVISDCVQFSPDPAPAP
jgi:hypothetical protein